MRTSRFLYQKLRGISKSATMSLSYDGVRLEDSDDISNLRDAFLLWTLTMWDLAPPSQRHRLYDVLPQLLYKLCGCDVYRLVRLLDKIRAGLYNLPENASLAIDLFKGEHLGGDLSSGHVIVPMKIHCDAQDGRSYHALNTILCFLLKINIKLDVKQELEREYVHDELRLQSFQFNESILDDLKQIITNWFANWDYDGSDEPRHGPGAISGYGRIPLSEKYTLLGYDDLLQEFLTTTRDAYTLDYPRPPVQMDRTAEIVFVPKSIKTYRVICKEPGTLQYWQQMVSASLVRYIDQHPYLRKRIRISDQTLSRKFCLEASVNGEYATIDLTKASDTVSMYLVQRIFHDTPLLRAFVATRSTSVRLPSGETITTAKYAPMGSALCFPVECIIFAAACELAIAYSSGRRRRYRVYGDDIIIHRNHVPNLLAILDRCGFLPNREKSYFSKGSRFRESCGMEAFRGMNVTPVRLSRWYSGLSVRSDASIPRLIDLANTFFENGLPTARRAVTEVLLKLDHVPLFTVPYGIGVWSDIPTNFQQKRKRIGSEVWVRHGVLITQDSKAKLANEDIRLHEWFRRGGSLDGTVSIERTRVRWRATYSPLWFTTSSVE